MKMKFGVLLLLVCGSSATLTANAADRQTFVRDFYAAYKAKDPVRLAQFYAPNATFVDPSFELNLKGPDQIRDLFKKVLPKYESLDFQIDRTGGIGNDLTVEGTMVGKIGEKTVRVPFVSSFHFHEDKILAQRDLFDVTHFLVQVGAIPPPFDPKPAPSASPAHSPVESELKETIARMDAKMFDAFNAHDVDLLMSLFTNDLEFYHDKGGLTNPQQTREGFTGMFAHNPDIRRELVKGSLEVYPIKDYGAIEIGTHQFCHKENGKDDCGNFPFVMVWKKIGDSWQISRVISYGHKM